MDNQCLTQTNTAVPLYDSLGQQVYFDAFQVDPVYLEPCQTVLSPTLEWLIAFAILFFIFFAVVRFIIKYVGKIL